MWGVSKQAPPPHPSRPPPLSKGKRAFKAAASAFVAAFVASASSASQKSRLRPVSSNNLLCSSMNCRSEDVRKGLMLAGPYRRSRRQFSIVAGSIGSTQLDRTA